ncbi:putative integral membrane protein [Rosellinia necatrix]|uniref:Putative integral membrane protein n=1 Tax=Rosellinia necatrix TaxID=77044 RepID=A0A1S8AAU8_ROSNE|nr:putative integral membrane protein [Rosellinia necatrix]
MVQALHVLPIRPWAPGIATLAGEAIVGEIVRGGINEAFAITVGGVVARTSARRLVPLQLDVARPAPRRHTVQECHAGASGPGPVASGHPAAAAADDDAPLLVVLGQAVARAGRPDGQREREGGNGRHARRGAEAESAGARRGADPDGVAERAVEGVAQLDEGHDGRDGRGEHQHGADPGAYAARGDGVPPGASGERDGDARQDGEQRGQDVRHGDERRHRRVGVELAIIRLRQRALRGGTVDLEVGTGVEGEADPGLEAGRRPVVVSAACRQERDAVRVGQAQALSCLSLPDEVASGYLRQILEEDGTA